MYFIQYLLQNKILLFVLVLAIIVLTSVLLFSPRPTNNPVNAPVIIFSPSPSADSTQSQIPSTPTTPENPNSPVQLDLEEKGQVTFPSWVNQLPLKNPSYYVQYDYQNQQLKGTLYPEFSYSVPEEEQIQSMKELIIKRLQQIGVNTFTEKIVWEVVK